MFFTHMLHHSHRKTKRSLPPQNKRSMIHQNIRFLEPKHPNNNKTPLNLGQVVGQTKSSGKAWKFHPMGMMGKNFQDDFSYLDRFGLVVWFMIGSQANTWKVVYIYNLLYYVHVFCLAYLMHPRWFDFFFHQPPVLKYSSLFRFTLDNKKGDLLTGIPGPLCLLVESEENIGTCKTMIGNCWTLQILFDSFLDPANTIVWRLHCGTRYTWCWSILFGRLLLSVVLWLWRRTNPQHQRMILKPEWLNRRISTSWLFNISPLVQVHEQRPRKQGLHKKIRLHIKILGGFSGLKKGWITSRKLPVEQDFSDVSKYPNLRAATKKR